MDLTFTIIVSLRLLMPRWVGPARRIQSGPWLSRASRLDIDLRRVESALCRQSTHEPGRDKSGELPWASFWGAATARCHNLAD